MSNGTDEHTGNRGPGLDPAWAGRAEEPLPPKDDVHPSDVSDARILLLSDNPARALGRLGNIPPKLDKPHSLELRQRWHHLRAETLIELGLFYEAQLECAQGLTLVDYYGGEPEDQYARHMYEAALVCAMAEAQRRNGRIEEDVIERLTGILNRYEHSFDPSYQAIRYVGYRTLALNTRARNVMRPRARREAEDLFQKAEAARRAMLATLEKRERETPLQATGSAGPDMDKLRLGQVSARLSALTDLPYPSIGAAEPPTRPPRPRQRGSGPEAI